MDFPSTLFHNQAMQVLYWFIISHYWLPLSIIYRVMKNYIHLSFQVHGTVSGLSLTFQGPSSSQQTVGGVMYAGGAAGHVRGLRLWWGTDATEGQYTRATVTIWRTGRDIWHRNTIAVILIIFSCALSTMFSLVMHVVMSSATSG